MPTVAVNGLELYQEEHGSGEPLLCVQGLGGDVSGWQGQLPLWSEHYRTVVFDNRDVGRSSYVSGDYRVAEMAADTLALADALGLERFHLLGMSLGGAIAQELALAAPERVLTLTLVVTYAGADRWMRDRTMLEERLLGHKSEEHFIDELLLLTLSPVAYEHASQINYLKNLILEYPHRQRRDGFVRQLRASATHDARDRLGALSLPVHVIGAEQDLLVPLWRSRELAASIPGARLSVIAGCGHAVNTERPQELAEVVHAFVQEDRALSGAA